MAHPPSERVAAVLFSVVAGCAGFDLFTDILEGASRVHLVVEGVLLVVGMVGAGWMLTRLVRMALEAKEAAELTQSLQAGLAASQQESERWRHEAAGLLAGLSGAIDAQLERWGLSVAEKDIALLLLKGLSHKEVAEVRSVSEATVRQQARAVYRKANLGGRNELAAFFLEDLLVAPRPPPTSSPG